MYSLDARTHKHAHFFKSTHNFVYYLDDDDDDTLRRLSRSHFSLLSLSLLFTHTHSHSLCVGIQLIEDHRAD